MRNTIHALATALQPVLCLLLMALLASVVDAAPATESSPTRGSLLLRGATSDEAPLLKTEVDWTIAGMVARVTVRQRFRNPSRDWAEGIYVFPLPDDAAVDRLRLVVGERVIEGEIREREAAKRAYVAARDSGRRAGLVEQERANIFTTSVANIGPGEEVAVEIAFQQAVTWRDGEFRLRFPLVVGPRYVPGQALTGEVEPVTERLAVGNGWARPTAEVPDAPRITPPVYAPGEAGSNPVAIDVLLQPGVPLAAIDSPHHAVIVAREGGAYRVRLAEGPVPADRDFELTWRPEPASAPRAALFGEQVGDRHYALLTVLPPSRLAADQPRPPRDLVLVIDVSGSMHGGSLEQAKAALDAALARLAPGDRFNVIRFNNSASSLFPAPVPANGANLGHARRWVARLDAGGGTEMAAALRLALGQGEDAGRRLRQVVFVTDGAVGNEEGLFKLIATRLGDARLFTVGIGSAPNSHFMRRAARFGRGSFVHAGNLAQVNTRIDDLLRKLDRPALTGVTIDWGDAQDAAMLPDPVPDLYADEPVQVLVATHDAATAARVAGTIGVRHWEAELALNVAPAAGIAKLWGRRRIAALMEQRTRADDAESRDRLRAEVVDVALAHGLLSRFTSLVAIERTPARPAGEGLGSHDLKTEMPHGWDHAKVFGAPRTATPAPLHLLLGLLLLAGGAWLRHRAPA